MNNILLLSAGRRVELAASFKVELEKRKLKGKVLATDLKPELSAACQMVDIAIKAPRVTESGYIDFLLGVCRENGVGLVIPTIDTELALLARHQKDFLGRGTHLVISEESLVLKCRDKRLTSDLFAELNIDTPRLYARSGLQFPCFAKPYDGSSSVGACVVQSGEVLSDAMLADEKMMFMELIDRSYSEFTVDAYYDRYGALACLVPRQRIEVRGGEVSKGVTRRHHVYDYLLSRLPKLVGARGCITFQLFAGGPNDRFAAIEINPRFGGGFPLSYNAGANYPGWLIDEYLLDKKICFYDSWEPDLMMLRYDAKVLVHNAA